MCISVKNGAPASTLVWVLGSHEHACSISAVTSPTCLPTTFVYTESHVSYSLEFPAEFIWRHISSEGSVRALFEISVCLGICLQKKTNTVKYLILYEPCIIMQYYICSPTRYTTSVMVEYLFTICLTARHVSDLQVHPQEHTSIC